MRLRLLYLLLFVPFTGFSQLDSLKGHIRSARDSISYIDPVIGYTFSMRENNFGQYSLTEESCLQELKQYGIFPWMTTLETKEKQFNRLGQLTKKMEINRHYSITSTIDYSYNEYNDLVLEKRSTVGEDGDNITTIQYSYRQLADSQEHIIASISYGEDPERFMMQQYFYDKDAKLIDYREFSSTGMDRQTNYAYIENNKLSSTVYSGIHRIARYDQQKNINYMHDSVAIYYREDLVYAADGLLEEKISGCEQKKSSYYCHRKRYEYDKKNRISAIWFYWRDSLSTHREYQYNADNSIRKISWFDRNEKRSQNYAEYFYDNGELTKLVLTTNGKITTTAFEYETDREGNWTKQTRLLDGCIQYIRNRVLQYWD